MVAAAALGPQTVEMTVEMAAEMAAEMTVQMAAEMTVEIVVEMTEMAARVASARAMTPPPSLQGRPHPRMVQNPVPTDGIGGHTGLIASDVHG